MDYLSDNFAEKIRLLLMRVKKNIKPYFKMGSDE